MTSEMPSEEPHRKSAKGAKDMKHPLTKTTTQRKVNDLWLNCLFCLLFRGLCDLGVRSFLHPASLVSALDHYVCGPVYSMRTTCESRLFPQAVPNSIRY